MNHFTASKCFEVLFIMNSLYHHYQQAAQGFCYLKVILRIAESCLDSYTRHPNQVLENAKTLKIN